MVRNKCVTNWKSFFFNVTKAHWLHINKCKNAFGNQMRKIKEHEKIEGNRSGT